MKTSFYNGGKMILVNLLTLILLVMFIPAYGEGEIAPNRTELISTGEQPVASNVDPSANIAVWGDSLTPGLATQLQYLFPTREVFNGGVGGQGSKEIAARQGGVVPLMSVEGNLIPATGKVAVIGYSITLARHDGGPGPVEFSGTLAGIHGKLTYDKTTGYHFERSTSGLPTVIGTSTPFIIDTFNRESWINIFWYGRNNSKDFSRVKLDIAASVSFLSKGNNRFIVLSVLNGNTSANEIVGTGNYNKLFQINSDLKTLFPSNYIDIRGYLISQSDPTSLQDAADNKNDIVPTSLRVDGIHLNEKGNLLLAGKIKEFINAKGW